MYAEWARGDFSRSDLFDPAMTMEWFGMAEIGRAEGYEEVVAGMRDWLGVWERGLAVAADEFIGSGDRILVLIRWKGKGKGSGVEMEASGAHLWSFRDGLAVDLVVYRNREEAREAFEAG